MSKSMIPRINPVARAVAINRRRSQVVQPQKGKGSYDRNKIKSQDRKTKDETDKTDA